MPLSLRVFFPETHFVSTVHQIFSLRIDSLTCGISAIRIVERVIFVTSF